MITQAQSKLIRKLKSRKQREALGSFLAEGVRVVEELLASGWEAELAVTSPGLTHSTRGRRLLDEIERRGWPRVEVSDAQLGKLADTRTPQGVLAVARHPQRWLGEFQPGAHAAVARLPRRSPRSTRLSIAPGPSSRE